MNETIDLFNQCEKDSFSIVHIDIRSLSKNLFKLIDFVSQSGKQPDVTAVSETKHKQTHQISYNISLCGYNFVHADTDKNAGGVGLYIKNSIDFLVLSNLKLNIENCENIWIELQLNNRKFTIGVVYRHPTPNYDIFSDELFAIIDHLNNANYMHYICGDFNIYLLKYFSQMSVANYADTLQSLSCKVLLDKPTRLTGTSATLIDPFYTNDHTSEIISGISVYDLSDHLPIFIILKSTKPRKTFYGYKIRDMRAFKANDFVLDLQEHLSLKLNFDNSTFVNEHLKLLYKTFHEVLEIHAPLCNASEKKTVAKKTLVNIQNL